MIVIIFPKKDDPSSAKSGCVDPTLDKVFNSTVFWFYFKASAFKVEYSKSEKKHRPGKKLTITLPAMHC